MHLYSMPEDSGSWYKSSALSLNWVVCVCKESQKKLNSFRPILSVIIRDYVRYFPKEIFPSRNFLKVFSELATSQVCPIRSAKPPAYSSPTTSAPHCSLRKVAAKEVARLGICHLGNCQLGSHLWKIPLGKYLTSKGKLFNPLKNI